jgi:hypothetical protein
MFSRSFSKSKKQAQKDIAERARVNCESVRRSSACCGEHNYIYTHHGFRVFKNATATTYHAQHLIEDFSMVYEEGNATLPYHAAITALHHKTASTAVSRFLCQRRNIHKLVHLYDTPAPTPAPERPPIEFDYERSKHLLAKMEFALPPYHPKRTVIVRGVGIGVMNFDATQLPLEQRFIKSCCLKESSADTCCCHVGSSHESVQYVNSRGDLITVHYFRRKNEYFNTTFRMWGDDSDCEKAVPHSPESDISETEIYPYPVDSEFEDELKMATEATCEGFAYVWKNKRYQRRCQRRQLRCQQLASSELPKYGLILVHVETKEIRSANPHPIPEYDEECCQSFTARYEQIRADVHARAIKEGTLAPIKSAAPAPAPRFETTGLVGFQLRRLIFDEYREQAIRNIQRPLMDASLCIAHAVSRLQVTEISALKTYQRTRVTAFASFTAILAVRFSAEKGHIASVATILHHRVIQHILRRATGSMACAQQISAPYIKHEHPHQCMPAARLRELRAEAERRFDAENPSGVPLTMKSQMSLSCPCSTLGGPIEYHTAKYYAEKCLELIGNPDIPTVAAARWTNLDDQVLRVRRGEITASEVFASPQHNNWVFMVHYTYIIACRQFISAVELWRSVSERGKTFVGPGNQCPSIWRDSHIKKDSSSTIQTVQIVHDMYRFILRAARVISPQYMAVFGFNQRYMNTIINKTKSLAYNDGDETSALMFGFLMPVMMTPDIHLDILAESHLFQHPDLYVKMSDPSFGPIKKQFRDMIPSRHTGTIDRTTLMDEPKVVRRG